MRCKVSEMESKWKSLENENRDLKERLKEDERWTRDGRVEKYTVQRGGQNVSVAVIVDTEHEQPDPARKSPQSQKLTQPGDHLEGAGAARGAPPGEYIRRGLGDVLDGASKQNGRLKDNLRLQNTFLREELKRKSSTLREELKRENEQLKNELKEDNEMFKRELQKENDHLIVELRTANEQLKVDLKEKSEELKRKMRTENNNLKLKLKAENEELKSTLKAENEVLKFSLKNETEHLKLELKRENDILRSQLEAENEELMIELQQRNDDIREQLRNKTRELTARLEQEFAHVNRTLRTLEHRNRLQNYTLIEVKEKISKLFTYCQMLPADICGDCACTDDFEQENKYYCDCTKLAPKRDCLQHLEDGHTNNGVYTIEVVNYRTMRVWCDQEHGGWIVIQRRMNGKLHFYHNWDAYKHGFGDVQREFWIGNDNLHVLSASRLVNPSGTELRIDLEDWSNKKVYAAYNVFKVDRENTNYRLHVGGFTGTAGDSMSYHNNMMFSTPDRDHDLSLSEQCSENHRGSWWHRDCHESNLNGEYLTSEKRHSASSNNVIWRTFKGYNYSLKRVEMKIRRKV